MSKPHTDELITVPEVATAMNRHRLTIIRWCQSGYLRGAIRRVGPGKTQPWLIPASEVKRLGGVL